MTGMMWPQAKHSILSRRPLHGRGWWLKGEASVSFTCFPFKPSFQSCLITRSRAQMENVMQTYDVLHPGSFGTFCSENLAKRSYTHSLYQCWGWFVIGTNMSKLMEPRVVANSWGKGPHAVRTVFAWVINGPLQQHTVAQCENGCPNALVNRFGTKRLEEMLSSLLGVLTWFRLEPLAIMSNKIEMFNQVREN